MALNERQLELRERFIDARGNWNSLWEGLLILDCDFFEAYLDFSSVPWRKGPLERKVKELIHIALDASTTHLYEPGLRQHIRNAIGYGATKQEIMEVLELTSVLGIHTCILGVPVLLQELAATNAEAEKTDWTPRRLKLKAEFEEKRGYWNEFWEGLLALDPDFFDAYLRFSAVPWVSGVLEPKVKELIYTAIDASTTHLYEPGLRQHVRNALRYGASKEEIMEVYELASVLGIHTCTLGVPILIDEFEKRSNQQS